MTADASYTTEEIAKLLKISKLTVYDLIKKGELPAYRVGKQMRVDAADLERYKARAKSGAAFASAGSADRPAAEGGSRAGTGAGAVRPLVITGQDVSLDLLAKHLESAAAGVRPLRSHAGSLDSLVAMYRGESDIVSTHLFDGDSGEYNMPYIRRLLTGRPYVVVNLVSRMAGLYVRSGNPKSIRTWTDLGRPGVKIVNRELGSGARVLLDEQLRLHGIAADRVNGYRLERTNHVSVAGAVATGDADAGVGIEKAAALVGGVDFIPLIRERYDLVMLRTPDNRDWIGAVLSVIGSAPFRRELEAIGGYDLSLTGTVLSET
ncbi:helix-turn-helix transcriptional regulator [Paenibacillus flagellatus]|uniref:Excisionase n=1 Tax=Paenibacillus flagellatus TaxID=2211139 RepID=A0A2V5KDS9_9BACL|nr:helix-turn-helix transcriptional regulator [Paenibacillus flagellatus]PYI52090.1 hypothetical protein DLM86_21645 [Paenibacillus flagellatus]